MTPCYAIAFAPISTRVLLMARPEVAVPHNQGGRPFIWTRDVSRAEAFSSKGKAEAFAAEHLPHGNWSAVVIPPRGLPTNDLGGPAAVMQLAA